MSAEEQALFEELEREASGGESVATTPAPSEPVRAATTPKPAETAREQPKEPMSASPRRNDPEPG